jgi:diguanylate cyclase
MSNSTIETISSRDEIVLAIEKARAVDPVVTMLQVDIDRFLEFTEHEGSAAGDALLATVSAFLQATADDEEWSYRRIGGDEFALFTPGVGLEQGFLRAEQLRVELDETLSAHTAGALRCTASIGVANLPRDAKTPEDLLRKADLALHAAKDQGGDAVGLTPGDEMVLKSSYYQVSQLGRLKALAERLEKKEAPLLREALDDLLRKYDRT